MGWERADRLLQEVANADAGAEGKGQGEHGGREGQGRAAIGERGDRREPTSLARPLG